MPEAPVKKTTPPSAGMDKEANRLWQNHRKKVLLTGGVISVFTTILLLFQEGVLDSASSDAGSKMPGGLPDKGWEPGGNFPPPGWEWPACPPWSDWEWPYPGKPPWNEWPWPPEPGSGPLEMLPADSPLFTQDGMANFDFATFAENAEMGETTSSAMSTDMIVGIVVMSVIATLALAMLIQKALAAYNESSATVDGTKDFVGGEAREMEDLTAAKNPDNQLRSAP